MNTRSLEIQHKLRANSTNKTKDKLPREERYPIQEVEEKVYVTYVSKDVNGKEREREHKYRINRSMRRKAGFYGDKIVFVHAVEGK